MIRYTQEEIDKFLTLSVRELVDNGVCPTCLDR